jgi:hypothetical protein
MPIEVVVQILMLNVKFSYAELDCDPGFVKFEAPLREENPETNTGGTMGRRCVSNSRGRWGIASS